MGRFTLGIPSRELYQMFQINLRKRFPSLSVIIATLSNEWQPGYLPEASSYGYGIYQEKLQL